MSDQRTVTISIPPRLAREVDRVAREEGRSRSELFREAARQYLQRRRRWEGIFSHGRAAARRLGLSEDDVDRLVRSARRRRG